MIINTIVQARMGSNRFPGKVMAEVAGKPLIGFLLDRIVGAKVDKTIVAIPATDENVPLRQYLFTHKDIYIVEGLENDVAERFRFAIECHPCDAFVRVCADSPFLDTHWINRVVEQLHIGHRFVAPRSITPGFQAEGVRTDEFLRCLPFMNDEQREHVTSFWKTDSHTIDTYEDLERLRPALEDECPE